MLMLVFVSSCDNRNSVQAPQMKAPSNCKQIIGLLLAYAAENDGHFPDSVTNPVTGALPLTSNDAFRTLFQEGLTQEEKIFGCPTSCFSADSNIGVAPTFDQTLRPGENQWAMTAGLTIKDSGAVPLVFENPVTTTWPPQWNASAAGKPLVGRARAGGKVVIGKLDGSVEVMLLQSTEGESVGPALGSDGMDLFTRASPTPRKILNVAIGVPPPVTINR
jgi:hypothetical protein